MDWLIALAAFLCGAALDFMWTRCVDSVQTRKPFVAANMSVLIYLFTLVSTVLIVEKCVPAIVAYALGNWVGTYLAVKRKA
jgi:dolichyl-phosphate-mannose--protein O-mannosyl transferase